MSDAIVVMSDSVEATLRLGRSLGAMLEGGDVVALRGNLGAGKTQMVRGIAAGLGVGGAPAEGGAMGGGVVASPTFVLMSEYEGRVPVVHIDAYRMTGLGDLGSIGFEREMWEGAVTVIEWAERIEGDLPWDRLDVTIEHVDESERRITLRAMGKMRERAEQVGRAAERATVAGKCPSCGEAVWWDEVESPFCSTRCRMADLNKWFRGDYRVSRPVGPTDDLE